MGCDVIIMRGNGDDDWDGLGRCGGCGCGVFLREEKEGQKKWFALLKIAMEWKSRLKKKDDGIAFAGIRK